MYNVETVTVGLIKGRHEMPVEKYIFNDEIKDVFDFDFITQTIRDFIKNEVGVEVIYGYGINQAYLGDVDVYKGKRALTVYVTGLTSVTAALIGICAENGIKLTLMHFDRDTNSYKEQRVLF